MMEYFLNGSPKEIKLNIPEEKIKKISINNNFSLLSITTENYLIITSLKVKNEK
jgi:hypothetical protein